MNPILRQTSIWMLAALAALASGCGSGAPGSGHGPAGAAGQAGAAGDLPDYRPGSDELWILEAGPRTAQGPREGPGSGTLVTRDGAGTTVPLPLRHTDVRADVRSHLSTVDVRQSFHNPFATRIEAVYLFPLPADAAVREFVMAIGERRIRGIIRPREEARAIYLEARSQGHRAALLQQHRPNVFEQSVANLEPGDEIDVHIRYFHTLEFTAGGYEFVFPMVVGPRYDPPGFGQGIGAVPAGAPGASGQPAEVAYLHPGQRSGHDLALRVDLDAGVPIRAIDSPSHRIDVQRSSGSRATVTLAGGAVIPDRDFVLRYSVAGERSQAHMLVHRDGDAGWFTMTVHPPAVPDDLPRQPMELVFVLDCSGSMSGAPMEQVRAAVGLALDRLGPQDSFQIIRFSSDASHFTSGLLPANGENLARARDYLRALRADGGTEMLSGLRAALDLPHDSETLRFVAFLTDGYIGNEREVFDELRARLGAARVFSLGIGSSVNRYLLEGLARMGRGAVGYLLHDEEPGRAVAELYERIARPALTDLRVDWGGLQVAEVFPAELPDLFVGRPLVLTGRLLGGEAQDVRVCGRVGGRPAALEVTAGAGDEGLRELPALWARRKIRELSDFAPLRGREASSAEVRDLALAHGLLSDFTSCVAVDATGRTAGDHGVTVAVPVPVPAGVRYETTVGGR